MNPIYFSEKIGNNAVCIYKIIDNKVFVYDTRFNNIIMGWLELKYMCMDYITSLEQISKEEAMDILFLEGL